MVQGILILVLVLLAAVPGAAQDLQEYAEGETPEYSDMIVPRLNALVLVASPDAVVPEGLFDVRGVVNKGVPLLDEPALKARLARFLGRPLTVGRRAEILNEIVYYFREHGRPFVDVSVMPQDVTYGVLQIVVLQAKVGMIRVIGNRWFDSGDVAGEVRSKPGDPVDADALARDIDWLNRNPFRRVDLVYVKGQEFGQADLLLREVDRFPMAAYLGYDDSGTRATQNGRLSAGVDWGNAFGGDRRLDYNFLASPDLRSFRANSLSFTQPLPWRHLLTVFGSYADIKADLPAPLDMSGYNWQTSARYEVPLPATVDLKHSVTAGFDFKRFNNDLTFGGVSVFTAATEVAQWSLGYDARLKDRLGETSLRATGVFSTGGLGGRNDDAAFQESRAGARSRYAYGKLELTRTTDLPLGLALVDLLTLQQADANLLASEQLGFGGYDSIRGYDTRVFNSDSGFIVSTELRSPSFPGLSALSSGLARLGDQWQALAFVDFGAGRDHLLLPGESGEVKLWSAGPGLRYNAGRYLTLRADYGWQLLDQAEAQRPYASRSHLSAIVRY